MTVVLIFCLCHKKIEQRAVGGLAFKGFPKVVKHANTFDAALGICKY